MMHSVWEMVQSDAMSQRKSSIKAKLLINCYILQGNKARYGMVTNSVCPLCNQSSEDRMHFIFNFKSTQCISVDYDRKF